jgi:hypothetical protein
LGSIEFPEISLSVLGDLSVRKLPSVSGRYLL